VNEATSLGPGPLALSARRRVDTVCDRFEAAWGTGVPPRLEDFLGEPSRPEGPVLLRELVLLDLYYRRQGGQECRAEDYTARFPDLDPAWLATALSSEVTALTNGPPASAPGAGRLLPAEHRDPRGDTVRPERPGRGALPGAAGGRYRLLEEVGRGGMGVVHKGRDPHLGRELAVKVLREQHQDDPQAVQRFLGEARIAGQLQHPGIVPVYELGNFPDGRPFFTMKLVQGQTLASLLAGRPPAEPRASATGASAPGPSATRAGGPVANAPGSAADLPHLLKIFEQVCQTVAYAHSKGVIHRDLKPANVMVGAFGEVQVMDWGLAKFLGDDPEEPAGPDELPRKEAPGVTETDPRGRTGPDTEPGAVLGTYAYMAPEQARGAVDALDERTDVFGLGAILCEVLTGQPPYAAAETWQVYPKAAAADLAEAAAQLDRCGADAELVALAKRCLAVEPRDRPRHAGEVAGAVTAYLSGAQERLRRAELERAAAQARAEEERKRRRVAAALAAAIVLLFAVGGGAWLWVATDRAQRRARADAALDAALDKAESLHRQARAKTANAEDPARAEAARALWRQGLAAAEQAQEIAAAGLAGDAAARRVELLLAALRAGEEQADKAARMLDDLDNARLAGSTSRGGAFDSAAGADQYHQAFARYGLDVLGPEPAAAVQALGRLPVPFRRALIVGLDDWYAREPKEELAQRLRRVADRADNDPWRRRFRHARNPETLKQLARDARRRHASPVNLDLLALGLGRRGARSEAVALLREAYQRDPADFWINYHLGYYLWEPKEGPPQQLGAAIGFRRVAVALRPRCAAAHDALGLALYFQGSRREGIAAFRRAIALDRRDGLVHNNLGNALAGMGDRAGAIAEYRQAVALSPKLVEPPYNLGVTLREEGRLQESLACFRRLERMRAGQPNWGYPSAQWLKEAERLVDLARQLPTFLNQERQPRSVEERLELAQLCYYKKRFAAGVRFYRAAFAADQKSEATARNDAACLAALAGCGHGRDAAALNREQRAELRGQALAWLRADLKPWQGRLRGGKAADQERVRAEMDHWLRDPNLAGVRDEKALAGLPAAERRDWQQLWAEVRRLAK
jgi:serine/threonine-protein kinase